MGTEGINQPLLITNIKIFNYEINRMRIVQKFKKKMKTLSSDFQNRK